MRNRKVNVEKMVEHAYAGTCKRVAGLHVLAIQDTTTLRDDGKKHSIAAHPTIAVDAEAGTLLGLVHAQMLKRKGGLKASCAARAIEDKESWRWLEAAEVAAGLRAAGAARVTVVADREGDIYEAFAHKPEGVELLIRANHDRTLTDGERLFARVAAQPEAGRFTVDISAAPGRKARQALLAVRFCRAEIKRPGTLRAFPDLPKGISVNLVEVREIDPPPGTKPVCWRLLTTHEVDSFATARWIAGLYCKRWMIEELFRTLKTRGFDIERVGIAEGPFEKLATAAIIAAVSIMQMVRERDGRAGRPLEDVFEPDERPALEAVCAELEGKTEKQKNPHPRGSLAFASWVCARLGGWTGYYRKPGPVVMLKGLHRFRAIQQGWNLARDV